MTYVMCIHVKFTDSYHLIYIIIKLLNRQLAAELFDILDQ